MGYIQKSNASVLLLIIVVKLAYFNLSKLKLFLEFSSLYGSESGLASRDICERYGRQREAELLCSGSWSGFPGPTVACTWCVKSEMRLNTETTVGPQLSGCPQERWEKTQMPSPAPHSRHHHINLDFRISAEKSSAVPDVVEKTQKWLSFPASD